MKKIKEHVFLKLRKHTNGMTTQADNKAEIGRRESLGQLVVLGFDVAVFTPTPYQRSRLERP